MSALLVQGHSPHTSVSPQGLAKSLHIILWFNHLLRDPRLMGAQVRIGTQVDLPPPLWISNQERHWEVKETKGKGFLERLPPLGMI